MLRALLEYYEARGEQNALPRPGWGLARVTFALSLGNDGQVLGVVRLFEERISGKKTTQVPMTLQVPEPLKRTAGVAPNFLCDNAVYLLGIDTKGKPERARMCFDAAKELHLRLLEAADSPAARAVCAFFTNWLPECAQDHPAFAEHLEELNKGGNLVFRFAGEFVQRDAAARAAWQTAYGNAACGATAICPITGERAVPARLHPAIKGVRGAQSTGASLVSFNADAYNSFGKEQGMNAPVSEYAAFAYGAALNHLLSGKINTTTVGDATVVHWAKGGQDAPCAMMRDLFNADNKMDDNGLMAAMARLANGMPTQWEGEEVSPDTEFYILGLAPNAARLSVRFYLRDTFGVFARRMLAHQQRLEIRRPAYDNREQLSFGALLYETINPKSRDKAPSPVMAGALVRAVLEGGQYPATLLHGVMLRIRAEQTVTRGRAAILKAYYLRNPHPDCPKEVLTVSLSDSQNVPYVLGQVFSVLEEIQEKALGDINTTIRDKYFSTASTRPDTVFPMLINLAQKHIKKLEDKDRFFREKELMRLLGYIQDGFPKRLNLAQQGAFQLGFYHMTQKRYTKKEDKPDV